MKVTTTDKLYQALINSDDVTEFLEKSRTRLVDAPMLKNHLDVLLKEHGVNRAEVIRRGDLDSSYAYQVFRGEKQPSREVTLQLAFGFGLKPDAAQKLLKTARAGALYARDRRDAIILFALEKGWTLEKINAELDKNKMKSIGNIE